MTQRSSERLGNSLLYRDAQGNLQRKATPPKPAEHPLHERWVKPQRGPSIEDRVAVLPAPMAVSCRLLFPLFTPHERRQALAYYEKKAAILP